MCLRIPMQGEMKYIVARRYISGFITSIACGRAVYETIFRIKYSFILKEVSLIIVFFYRFINFGSYAAFAGKRGCF